MRLEVGSETSRKRPFAIALWWRLVRVLGWINSRVLLTALFVLLLTPIGLLWRLIGHDPLRRRRESGGGWMPYPVRYRDRRHYDRMF